MKNENSDEPAIQRYVTYEEPGICLFRDPMVQSEHRVERHTIHVEWDPEKLSFSVLNSPNGEFRNAGSSTIRGGFSSIETKLEEIAVALKSVSIKKYRNPDARRDQLTNIEALGEQLFKNLIPSTLQKLVKSWKGGSWIAISTNERWIPWELLHDGSGFFGNRFYLYRLPRVDLDAEEIKRYGRPRESTSQPINDRKTVHVIGGGLKADQVDSSRKHFSQFSDVVELHEQGLQEVLNGIADSQVVHFTCHGHLNPLRLQISKEDEHSISLKIETIQMEKFTLTKGCLIFLNSCNSITPQPLFGRFLNFGWEYYAKGAGVFIGTLGAIPTDLAIDFAQSFYDALYGDAKGNVFAAFYSAKNATDQTSALHLLYSFYGNAIESCLSLSK